MNHLLTNCSQSTLLAMVCRLSLLVLKGRMILRCVKKAISYKCPYVIAIVVPYQIYTVVMMTICANQENTIV